MKILNLYAGIGGNRKLWGDEHEITAVELNPEIAKIYQDLFPNDKVIVADAHEYLLEHFKEFDFIWSSPPCPTHSRLRFQQSKIRSDVYEMKYPDMKLYQEIILLKHYFKGKYVVENVKSYYDPLIKPQESERHYFWCNFIIDKRKAKEDVVIRNISTNDTVFGFNISKYSLNSLDKRVILRNLVNPKLALSIFNSAFKEKQKTL